MDAKMRDLFERMKPYVEPHDYFDLVETKFGLLQVFSPDGDENCYNIVRDYAALRHLLLFEISADVREESELDHAHVDLHPSEAEETVRRTLPYLTEEEDKEYLRKFLRDRMRRS